MKIEIPTICNYCAGKVIFTNASILYGEKYNGKIYLCTNCNASVGVHNGTKNPLGTLANIALKLKRREAHDIFDEWWKTKQIRRKDAYEWLANQMKIPVYSTHIGQFDMIQCAQVIQIVFNENLKKLEEVA